MSITISESGMLFGEYCEADLFQMEKSSVYAALGDGVSTVEFVLRRKGDEILFIEAKQSTPHPDNPEDFDTFIDEVYCKFAHSVDIFFSLVTKRLEDKDNEMPIYFKTTDYSLPAIKLLLVINGHEIKWLPPVLHALRRKLIRIIKTWRLDIAVLNNEQALEYGLIKC